MLNWHLGPTKWEFRIANCELRISELQRISSISSAPNFAIRNSQFEILVSQFPAGASLYKQGPLGYFYVGFTRRHQADIYE